MFLIFPGLVICLSIAGQPFNLNVYLGVGSIVLLSLVMYIVYVLVQMFIIRACTKNRNDPKIWDTDKR